MAIFADPFFGVIFDTHILVLFGVHEYLFAPLFVFETEFVEAAAPLAAIGLDRGHGRIVRQRIWRFGFAVVNRAGDDWPVGIAIEKFDDDFLADARDENRAPILSRPRLGHAHPARGVFIRGTVAVPVKLNFNPAKFVGQDFFAGFTYDDCGLRPLDARLDRRARRTENAVRGNSGEVANEALFRLPPLGLTRRFVSFSCATVTHADNDVISVFIRARMLFKLEFRATDNAGAIGLADYDVVLGLK